MLNVDELLSESRRTAGLEDFGDMDFMEGFTILIKSINEEAGLSEKNESLYRDELIRLLVNRLRMQKDVADNPEILDEEILPPIFITSIPRTGSTKLHRILAASGDFNYLHFWHAYNFAPFPDTEGKSPDPRIGAAEQYLQWRYKTAPRFQIGHPVYTEDAEEELDLLDASFNSLYSHSSFLNVRSYSDWVLNQDGELAFRYLRLMLQYLQWQHHRGKKRRWILKTPALFGKEAAYAKVFEGMEFIVTHRHPVAVIPSTCTLLCGIREMYSDQDFTAIAGELMLHNFGESLKRHIQWRDKYPANKIIDVRFEDILKNEFDVLQKIYEFLDMNFSDTSRNNVQAWQDMDNERGHQRDSSSLADYGLTEQQGIERFTPYIERYSEFF